MSRQRGVTLFMTLLAAFQLLLHRYTGQLEILVGTPIANRTRRELEGLIGFFANTLVMRTSINPGESFAQLLERVREVALGAYAHQDLPFEKLVEVLQPDRDLSHTPLFQVMFGLQPSLRNNGGSIPELTIQPLKMDSGTAKFDLSLWMEDGDEQLAGTAEYNTDLFDPRTIERWFGHFEVLLEAIAANPEQNVSSLPLLTAAEQHELLVTWNDSRADYPDKCLHELFQEQVAKTPDAVAVAAGSEQLSYSELNRQANRLAHHLRQLGVGPEVLTGVYLERSVNLLVALLGILKAGGAYLPLDPEYPKDRLKLVLEVSGASLVLTHEKLLPDLPETRAQIMCLDLEAELISAQSDDDPATNVCSGNLAYVIYTSGSTGVPKGVMVSHKNVAAFFTGIDRGIGYMQHDAMLAVTSISFDISVLELFWPLTHGNKVILISEQGSRVSFGRARSDHASHKTTEFSLFYFSSDEAGPAGDKYKLLIEGAQFADQHGFAAVWTPERHFHRFGGLYASPSIISSALAMITSRVQLRAGSVVLPLHTPIRVAEEWSIIDNLSNGRVGVAFASGWHPDDFVLSPGNYPNRKDLMFREIETVQRLWEGGSVQADSDGGGNKVNVEIFPKPIQPKLPIWITCASSADTFIRAGKIGANVLTHMLGQTIKEVADNIALYRDSLARHGYDPHAGHVTIMLHTFVGDDLASVKEQARGPFVDYLRSSLDLSGKVISSLNEGIDVNEMTPDEINTFLSFSFERYFQKSSLIGTPATCFEMVQQLRNIGVDEIACLIDFGVDVDAVLQSLEKLDALRILCETEQNSEDLSLVSEAVRHGASLMQCTPSMMSMLMSDDDVVRTLGSLRQLLLGGEPLSEQLVKQVGEKLAVDSFNMYGPTETTIWSTVERLDPTAEAVSIGRPIANTQVFVLDAQLQPVPPGVTGELYIGGAGVARGYYQSPDLTAQRFIADPFSGEPGARLYRTGDLARYLAGGRLECLGRSDDQVKIRGHRVELTEIEKVLEQQEGVKEAAVMVREDFTSDKRLVAYLTLDSANGSTIDWQQKQISQWQTVWDDVGEQASIGNSDQDAGSNFTGWNSSYTGKPIPEAEMQEAFDNTADRILALNPNRVLEIGCGTGLVLFRVAPHCEQYCGTDISAASLRYIKQQLEGQQPKYPGVTLSQRAANSDDVESRAYDTVVINSVVQYFPSLAYLESVLKSALDAVQPGGTIFVGDVRSLPLLETMYAAVELHNSPSSTNGVELAQRVKAQLRNEKELAIDPAFFLELKQKLPGVSHVEVLLKKGRHHNELTRFRYDVVIYVEREVHPVTGPSLSWTAETSVSSLRSLLSEDASEYLIVKNIPNARLQDAGVDPQDLMDLCRDLPYAGDICWAGPQADDRFNAVYRRLHPGQQNGTSPIVYDFGDLARSPAPRTYANDPLRAMLAQEVVQQLLGSLSRKLPQYMVPSSFVLLEEMPLTPNGKLNRRALPAPEQTRPDSAKEYVAPRDAMEEMLATSLAQALSIDRVGIHDNFFELGGHSLLATQLISRLRDDFQVEVPLRNIFEAPTVAGLAESIKAARAAKQGPEALPLTRISRDLPLPLSFGQQRLWVLNHLEPDSPLYNEPILAVRLNGSLDTKALEKTFNEIIQRHEILRTRFSLVEDQPVQVISPAGSFVLATTDLCELPGDERETKAHQIATEEAQRPFDFENGPLFRVTLLKLGEREHILLVARHHIIFDGWSAGILIYEITTLYQSFATGQPSPLPELPIQYADFAHWQRNWLQGPTLAAQLTYWQKQLGGSLPLLSLPSDRPRPPIQSFRGAIHSFAAPAALIKDLKALSRQRGVTLFMTLLAAFQLLLHRYTGQAEILVGTPIANRTRRELEGLIGFFANTLVMRTAINPGETFVQLLEHVREVALGAYANQDLPFEKLVEVLQPDRDLSHTPLFQVLFVFLNMPLQSIEVPNLTFEPIELDSGTAKFDLTVHFIETSGGMVGSVEYNTDLFDHSTIVRLLDHLNNLFAAIALDPDRPLYSFPLMDEAERKQVRLQGMAAATEYPGDLRVNDLFELQVQRSPDDVALVFNGEATSYAELEARSNMLANYLSLQGVGPEVLVGLCVERSPDMLVGVLGILKAGAAYLPLDPTLPRQRLAFMLRDAMPAILITQQSLREVFQTFTGPILCLDSDSELLQQQGGERPANLSRATADNLAYTIYTSGSTGTPKGVQITHRSVVNFLWSMQQQPGITSHDVLVAVTSLSFDIAVLELLLPLIAGAKVVIAGRSAVDDSAELAALLDRESATLLQATPATWRLLLEAGWHNGSSLKKLCGGESLPAELAKKLIETGGPLWNMYGPTETTIWSTIEHLDPTAGPVSIGRPIANTQVFVLDAQLQPVPPGVTGELYIGGAGVARGYYQSPDLTAQKFIADPFSGEPGARLYRTGDLARYLADGRLECLGRSDHQVKIRGHRVELTEIEKVLEQHEGVSEAAVLVREDFTSDKRLVAFFVPRSGFEPDTTDLREHLEAHLPLYMVPNAFVMLDNFPLTPSGKVDRRALKLSETEALPSQREFVPPTTEMEKALAEVWSQVLGVEKIGIHDNFFELGGHSMSAIQAALKLRQAGVTGSPQELFRYQTIASLAEKLEAHQTEEVKRPALQQKRVDLKTPSVAEQSSRPPQLEEKPLVLNNVFLTGATGYLGAYLLHEILAQTNANVFCLVRAGSEQEGLARISEQLHWCFPKEDPGAGAQRIFPVLGDLRAEKLGINPQQYQKLSEMLDAVYHSAADVRHFGELEHFKAVNVGGTRSVIELAQTGKQKFLHHVSTVYVSGEKTDVITSFSETDFELDQDFNDNPYLITKFLAERLIRESMANGTLATIHRTGNIAADSRTGRFQRNIDENAIYRALRAITQMRVAPYLTDVPLEFTQVDTVARAIVRLSLVPHIDGLTFHHINPYRLDFYDLVRTIQALGFSVRLIELDDYVNNVLTLNDDPAYQAELVGILPFLDAANSMPPEFENSFTQQWMKHLDLRYDPPGATWLSLIVQDCIERGFIQPPAYWDKVSSLPDFLTDAAQSQ
jgi:natural product biosynthesis luciferase-like monooxygenase protein/amino acid adenylation domain-containing protein/thioester reductase-like protein